MIIWTYFTSSMKSNSKSTLTGYILAFFGVVFFSAKAVIVKLAFEYDIDYLSLLLLRMVFALPFYIVVAIVYSSKHTDQQIKLRDWLWMVGFGFIGYYLASLFDFWGLEYIKASLERLVLFVYPTLVIIFSNLFLKIKITRAQIVAILVTYTGLVVAFYNDINVGSSEVLLGGGLILLSAICYAGYLTGSGWLIPKFGAVRFTSYAMIISCACVVIHFGLKLPVDHLLDYPAPVYWYSLLMAVVSTIIPSYMVSFAIKQIGAPNFSIVGSFGPISTIILASIFLDEQIFLLQGIGTLIVIAGVLYSVRSKK